MLYNSLVRAQNFARSDWSCDITPLHSPNPTNLLHPFLNSPTLELSSSTPPSLATMSFGFGISDILLLSRSLTRLYTAIHNAPTDQQTVQLDLETLRELGSCLTAHHATAPCMSSTAADQLLRCVKLSQDLDKIVNVYVGRGVIAQTKSAGRIRVFRWGLYKRAEFMQLLEDLRGRVALLSALQQAWECGPVRLVTFSDPKSPVHLIDALDRRHVCYIDACATWEVCMLLPTRTVHALTCCSDSRSSSHSASAGRSVAAG